MLDNSTYRELFVTYTNTLGKYISLEDTGQAYAKIEE